MGACLAGRPALDDPAELVEQIHQPVIDELARRGTPFVGCLFAGLMLTADGPRVLEFNARFGDPETQALIPRLEGDLLGALAGGRTAATPSAAQLRRGGRRGGDGRADRPRLPGAQRLRGRARSPGIAEAEAAGALVFHGGTAVRDGDARHERRTYPVGHGARARPSPTARERAYDGGRQGELRGHAVPHRHRAAPG